MTSSTVELIEQLDQAASDIALSAVVRTGVGIVLRFERGEGVVWSYDADRQAALDSLVKSGGQSIGMIRVSDDCGKVAVDSTLFDEYAGDLSAKSALKRICRTLGERLRDRVERAMGGPVKVECFEDSSGWPQ